MKTREDEIANLKKIIKLFYNPEFKGGLYNLRNVVGDKMTNIYKSKNIQLDICYEYDYFEVFGLTDEEFKDLQNYYSNLESRY